MTLLEALHVYFASKTAITDVVSTRLYRVKRPQGSDLPALTWRKVSGQDQLYQKGTTTLAECRVEVTCWASIPSGAETLRNAVRDVCQRYSGTITSGEESVVVVLIRIEDDAEFYDPPLDASDNGAYSATIDLHIWWRPPAPTG